MEFSLKLYCIILCAIPFVESFSWSNCGSPADSFKVLSLDVYSNQTKTLYITGRGKLAVNMTAPIQANVEMQKKFFWGWTKIPCLDQVGSCSYVDICDLNPSKDKPCPPEFLKQELPCRCPILQGQYKAKKFPIDLNILPDWIEEGKYRIKFTLSKSETQIACLLVYIEF